MRLAVNSHALPIYKKKRIASLLCIFETTINFSYIIDFIIRSNPISATYTLQQTTISNFAAVKKTKKRMIFHENRQLADDSQEISHLI